MTSSAVQGFAGRALKAMGMGVMILALAACGGLNLFSAPKIKEEEIIPAQQLYSEALDQMDRERFAGAITTLEKLERQHPYSADAEKAKLMVVYANFRLGKFGEVVLAADRFLAIYPDSKDVPYVLYLKGTAYFEQIRDITRDQQLSRDAIDTYTLVINNYPDSEYAKDARDKMRTAIDQLAGKEMSVGRYYLGNGQYTAAINRFRVVVENFQTSSHIEEALYRLTEANLALGLINEAQTAAAVLGHNYPTSIWYDRAYAVLEKQGLAPQINRGSALASLFGGRG